ncbi:hypothetical protein ACN9KI_03490 [Aliarcobacter butzleri]|uniref:hypothetical protein n=1 Tax=Aliarcobacter butzleri TaxID=28197 RepID=UPI003B222954
MKKWLINFLGGVPVEKYFYLEFEKNDYYNKVMRLNQKVNFLERKVEENPETHNILAELEKVIVNYYLAKGYNLAYKDWYFEIELISLYKAKRLIITFVQRDKSDIVFDDETETIKEIFDKVFEYFIYK